MPDQWKTRSKLEKCGSPPPLSLLSLSLYSIYISLKKVQRVVTRQDKARQDKTRQDKTRQDETRQGKTRQGKARQDKARQDRARQDKTRQGKTRQVKTRQDKIRHVKLVEPCFYYFGGGTVQLTCLKRRRA
jgi:hypothetical protein